MRLTLEVKRHQNLGQDNRSHFLVRGAVARMTAVFEGGSSVTVQGAGRATSGFTFELLPTAVPNATGSPGQAGAANLKQRLTGVEVEFVIDVTLRERTFTALKVLQRLSPVPKGNEGVVRVDYALAPAGWTDAAGRRRVANAGVHPLVSSTRLAAGILEVDTLMLDITDGWMHAHATNPSYVTWQRLSAGSGLTFKVFAHTSGEPFIWYAIVPAHLRGARPVSPHVFYQPSDNREGQPDRNDEAYLLRSAFETDGRTLMRYLLPPIGDENVDSELIRGDLQNADLLRNVVGLARAHVAGAPTNELTTHHWRIGAGLQKAFQHRGDARPAQLLLLPQRVGAPTSAASGSYGGAVTRHLLTITGAIFGLLESNTSLTLGGSDTLLARDKLVVSGYSESGFDLWPVGRILRDSLKALIAIEPQNLNSIQNDYRPTANGERVGPPPLTGREVIPELLQRGVKVFIIGRHHLHYRPQVPDITKIRLLPIAPRSVFAYPPDPTANDFIKYRVHRFVSPDEDPFMRVEERQLLDSIRTPGMSGAAIVARIFSPKGNEDASVRDGVERWYSHHFALTGGDEMRLDASAVYGMHVTYRTFFEVAVHEVG